MSRISSKTKATFIASLLALLGALCALSVLLFMIHRADTKLLETITSEKRLDDEEGQYSALQKLAKETEVDREELSAYILSEDEVIDFLSLIEKVGIDAGVSVTTRAIAVTKDESAPAYETVSIDLELEGASDKIRHVIDLYEHLPYQSRIEKISLDRAGGEDDMWRSSVLLSVTKIQP